MNIFSALKSAFREPPVADDSLWHRCSPSPLFCLLNGLPMGEGQMWRRRVEDGWEYQQNHETQEERDSRIW